MADRKDFYMYILLNPGHSPAGIPDPGAVHPTLGVRECDVALDICRQVKSFLEFAGCTVVLIQSNNLAGEEEAGENVCGTANRIPCDAFVSVHCNAAGEANRGRARGAETLCYSADSAGGKLAELIQRQLVGAMQRIDSHFPDRGVKERKNLVVLNSTVMAAALVEVAFIDNDEDVAMMLMYTHEIAAAIARGITDYWRIMKGL